MATEVTQSTFSTFQMPPDGSKVPEQGEHDALRLQLEQLFEQFDTLKTGRIVSRDLFSMIELFEQNQPNTLLKDDTRATFKTFCEQNPDMEVSVDDVLVLIAKLQPSAPNKTANASAPPTSNPSRDSAPLSGRTRMTPSTKFGSVRSNWYKRSATPQSNRRDLSRGVTSENEPNSDGDFLSQPMMDNESMLSSTGMNPLHNRGRRLSTSAPLDSSNNLAGPVTVTKTYYAGHEDEAETSFEGSGTIDETAVQLIPTNDDPAVQLSRLYRHTVELTKKLKESERHLASVARQHEDRIEELQHKLEETKADLALRKREIQDHKSKEKTNLNQISILESEISKVAKNLTGQKQLYHQLKKQYEEQCDEAEKLKDLVRIKEEELSNTERNLSTFVSEERKWLDERESLEAALNKLEADVALAQKSEIELEEQKNENIHLKATIDKLKVDLAEIRETSSGRKNDFDLTEFGTQKNLQAELVSTIRHSVEEAASDSNTDEVGREHRTNKAQRRRKEGQSNSEGAIEESASARSSQVEKHRHSEEHTGRKPNRSSRKLADGNAVSRGSSNIGEQYQVLSSELGVQYALIENLVRTQQLPPAHEKRDRRHDNDDPKTSRLNKKPTRLRKRGVTPIDIETSPNSDTQPVPSKAIVPRSSNMAAAQQNAVNSTVTFALYTLVVYLFGIITSVFVLDSNQGAMGGYGDWVGFDSGREDSVMARSIQIILYWMETLLNDGNNMVPT